FAAGRIGSFQVDQFRQNVQTTRSQYLAALDDYDRNEETFLTITMGLPPDLPIRVDESIVAPFQFTDPTLSALRTQVNALTERVRIAEDLTVEAIRAAFDQFEGLDEAVLDRFDSVKRDFERLDAVVQRRLEALNTEKRRKDFLEQVSRL